MAVDSTKLKAGEELHLVVQRGEEVVVFEISAKTEAEVTKGLIKGVRGKPVADREYAKPQFVRGEEGYIMPRGRSWREFSTDRSDICTKMEDREAHPRGDD